jgi:hypothetical protein
MARYLDTDELLHSATPTATRSLLDYKSDVVHLRPGPTGASVSKLRLLGLPLGFREHSNKMRDPSDPKKSVTVRFLDADLNRSFARVCTENPTSCPWCKLGYLSSQRFSMNVLDRADGRIKILTKGRAVYAKFAEQERANKQINAEALVEDGQAELLWTSVGGEVAPDVRITSRADITQLGGVSHTITFAPKCNTITPEEIAALGAINTPTAEEIAARLALDPKMKSLPEWFLYGYRLDDIHKPTVLRIPTSPSALNLSAPGAQPSPAL